MTAAEEPRSKSLMTATGRAYSGPPTTGDGDPCPLVPEHGRMESLKGSSPAKQWCPNQEHDGHGKVPGSRSIWPLYNLPQAVAEYRASHE